MRINPKNRNPKSRKDNYRGGCLIHSEYDIKRARMIAPSFIYVLVRVIIIL